MPTEPPSFRQRKTDNCALTCLRMILAYLGQVVEETTLESEGIKQPGGVDIEDLRQLAERFGLHAEIEALDLADLAAHVLAGVFPIVYLNRSYLDGRFPLERRVALRRCIVHAVIPVHFSRQFVTFLDPRRGGKRRISKRKFAAAQRELRNWSVVCRHR